MGKYLGLFVSEAGDHLQKLADGLVQLEKVTREGGDRSGPVDAMFRHAHSVKGMAAAMQLDTISALAHSVEDLLGGLRKAEGPVDAEVIDALLIATDELQAMVQGAANAPPPAAEARLVARLVQATALVRGAAAVVPPAAPPEPQRQVAQPAAEPAPPVAPARRSLSVEVEIAGSCPVPAVRGFLVLKKLGGLGNVIQSSPTDDDLRAGRIPGKRLRVQLESTETAQGVERALSQISDLAAVTVRAEAELPAAVRREAPAAAVPEGTRTVRVRTELLDYFLDAVGELILATARIREVGRRLAGPQRPALEEGVDRLHAIVKDLHDKVMAVRMTPMALVTDRLPRAARDLARKVGKQIEISIAGAEIELDRAILEELGDPMLHLLRNAVDHGLEQPHLRLLAGKPATGHIAVTARRERDRVILELSDDGKGMDPERLKQAAVARGAITAEQAAALGHREALMLACLPGVSTAQTVTDVSGRGVGMDAVKKVVETVGGTLEIDSAPGAGTRVTLRLPLTVAVQPVLLVQVGEEILGLPMAKVHGAAEVEMARLETSQGGPLLPHAGGHVPVHDLGRLLGFPGLAPRPLRQVLVAEAEGGRIGLAVDALLGQEEAVLKPLNPPLDLVPGLSAVTVLGNGRPVFILDVPRLLAA